jgi:hypothetical protein
VHSELDLFTPDQHAHDSHDYCEIVDSAKPENTDLDNCKTIFHDAPVVLLSVPVIHFCESQTIYYNTYIPKPDIKLNILYGSLLI